MNAMTAMNINDKKAVFVYGKFEPMNDTNKELIKKLVIRAKTTGADPYIIVTHTGSGVNAKKQKLGELFPNVTIMGTSSEDPKLGSIVKRLRTNKNYKNIEMVARSNTVDRFQKFMNVPVFNSGVSKTVSTATKGVTKPRPKPKSSKGVTKPKPKSSKGVTKPKTSDRNMRALERMMKNMF